MSSSLPRRPKNPRIGSRALEKTFATDSGSIEESAKMECRSSTEESDEERTINDRGIEDCMTQIHQLTISLTGILSKTVVLDRFSWPQLADMHIWYSECYHLFRLALGFEDENLDSVFRRLAINLDDISIYLRSLIVTDVYNRVLVTEFPDLPIFSRQWIDTTFDPMIRKWHTASQKEMKRIATKALSKQGKVNENLANLPERLTNELFEALNPLLLCHKSPAIDREASRSRRQKLQELYGSRLTKIYELAVTLRKDLSHKSYSYSFFWINAGENFNELTMDVEIHSRRIEFYDPASKEQMVVATMLPGVCRNDDGIERPMFSTEPLKEKNIVLRALVYLGENIA